MSVASVTFTHFSGSGRLQSQIPHRAKTLLIGSSFILNLGDQVFILFTINNLFTLTVKAYCGICDVHQLRAAWIRKKWKCLMAFGAFKEASVTIYEASITAHWGVSWKNPWQQRKENYRVKETSMGKIQTSTFYIILLGINVRVLVRILQVQLTAFHTHTRAHAHTQYILYTVHTWWHSWQANKAPTVCLETCPWIS